MRAYTLTRLSDAVLLRDLAALVAQDRTTTAALLAHLAEVDARRRKSEIGLLLAARFPRPEVPTRLQAISPPPPTPHTQQLDPDPVAQLAPGQVGAPAPQPQVAPLAPQCFTLQVTLDQATHDKLRYAQALLSHAISSGDVVEVLDRALDALIS